MKIVLRQCVFGLLACSFGMAPAAFAQEGASPQVVVEPNVLVTTDIGMGHTESDFAVNPLNPRDMVGGTTVFGTTNGPPYNKFYTSLDGGYTWTDTTPYWARQDCTGDPRSAFTNRGTALYVSLNLTKRRTDVLRSPDGGITWNSPAHFALYDHELVAVDRSHGRYSGRIYIAGEASLHRNLHSVMGGDRYVQIYVSDDDGRNFRLLSQPETGKLGAGKLFNDGGVAVTGIAVLSDGTVALMIARYFQVKIGYERNYVATSTDGGKTFAPPVPYGDLFMYNTTTDTYAAYGKRAAAADAAGDVSRQGQTAVMAADHSNGPYRDRLYAAWPDRRAGAARIIYRYSSDRGKTWSAVRRVGSVDPAEMQFQPMLATNNRGAVAILWYSTAGFPDRRHFNAYVAVSTNGGASFSAPARVSSQASYPRSPGNLLPGAMIYNATSARAPGFISAYSRWGAGGDYIGMDAGSDGIFHLYWPDSRGAEYQIYASRVQVSGAPNAPSGATSRDVTKDIVIGIDPLHIDPGSNEVDVPVRIRNVSQHTLFGPISMTFLGAQNAMAKNFGQIAPPMRVLNATSGGSGYGATFDYSNALGTYGALPPGGISEPIVWRFHLSNLDNLGPIALNVRVTARY